MDKESAIKLLDETFNNNFELDQYVKLIKELFNKFDLNQKSWSVWKQFQDYIESYQLLGSYKSSKKVIDVLVVKLKKTSSRDRARTMQRNFIAKYLGNAEKDAALVAFYGDDPQDWRFSFVKMEYQLVKEGKKVKVSKELTPAKRYSFLVGVNEPNHTAQQQLYPLLKEEDLNPTLEQIEQAFSIEKVTKIFFEKYKSLFLRLKESLEKVVKKDSLIKEEFYQKNISVVDFSKKLLGQIVFIYFLQKKGWLGVERGENWGTGPKNFMRKLLGDKNNKPLIKYKNFFNEILEPLFYDALANPREGDDGYHTHFKCKIPFLNGGLFEPMNDYDWIKTDILLDNDIFEDILDTFDEFNFTVKEDEPLEKEVAVDPEMLGKVFENLLEVKDRKSKGAFYTPREIVHYMCQQSLINYLETNTKISREDIEKFIQLGDFATSSDEKILEDIRIKQDKLKKGIVNASTFDKEVKQLIEKLSLSKSIIENKEKIDDLLKKIKVVDPAVGSGAFPVGMLNEIVKARSTLSIFFNKQRSDYDLKREIIENCLYGVDIDSSAVDITKLRFWLSLIVDELDMKNIKPLPNLDHKIMCGNSLLEEFEGKMLFDEKLLGEARRDFAKELKEIGKKIRDLYNDYKGGDFEKQLSRLERERKKIEAEARKDRSSSQATLDDAISKRIKESQRKLRELKDLQRKFFNEQNKKLKKHYRDQIDKLEWDLIEETLKEEGNEEAIEKLSEYKKNKSKPFFLWKLYFAEVFQRENPGFDVVIGNPPYITYKGKQKVEISAEEIDALINNYPNSAEYKINSYALFVECGIRFLSEKGTLTYIIPSTILQNEYLKKIRKHIITNYHLSEIVTFGNKVFEAVTDSIILFVKKEHEEENITIVKRKNELKFSLNEKVIKWNQDEWNVGHDFVINLKINKEEDLILKKIDRGSKVLDDFLNVYVGIVASGIKKFLSDKKENSNYKKYIQGKHIQKYEINPIELFINFDVSKLHSNTDERVYMQKEKILVRKTGNKLIASYDNKQYFTDQSIYNLYSKENNNQNLKYLLSILNSKIINYYFNKKMVTNADVYPYVKGIHLKKLPIKEISTEQQKPFIQLVDQILSITKDSDYLDNPDKKAKVKRLEKEIDQLVYKLYDLIPEEIKIIEEFNGK